jgi:hypothetical protein
MSRAAQQWFAVDKQGLADLVASKGKVFILHELLQNAWDCPAVKTVDVLLSPVRGAPLVDLTVMDDDPDGFSEAIKMVMPPDRVETFVNGEKLGWHKTADLFQAELPTVLADADTGILRDATRSCIVRLWEPREGEEPHLYEMGIPVVELSGGEPWHIDVCQKVPLSMERDNVTPLYLRRLRAVVLNRVASSLSPAQAKAPWVTSTLGSPWVDDQAVKGVIASRFGSKAVIADPSDREGEHMAVAQGYTVVPGGAFPAEAWTRIREADALKPAGQVTPSPKPFSPGGTPLEMIKLEDWSPDMEAFAVFARRFARQAAGLDIGISFTADVGWKFQAAYVGRETEGAGEGQIIFNASRLGPSWFDQANWPPQVELLIHELGHHWGQHLDSSYHEALCRIGREAVGLALAQPELFRRIA